MNEFRTKLSESLREASRMSDQQLQNHLAYGAIHDALDRLNRIDADKLEEGIQVIEAIEILTKVKKSLGEKP